MSEGVLTISMTGKLTSINSAAEKILSIPAGGIVGATFAAVFFKYSENDAFNQTILDAIYENTVSHNAITNYFDGRTTKKLFVNTSFLINDGVKIGVAAVMNDITELVELRDAMLAMERIKALNRQLEVRNEFIKKTFGRYLSDDIVDHILNDSNGLGIGGKKQVVTIMFSDLRGFTAISEKMEPHELIKMLNHYLSEMIEIIAAHNGTILEFIGDAIVSVYGAPEISVTAEADAVACAIEMQCGMSAVNAWNAERAYPRLEMGIGVHTGEVVLGNIGSERKTKYDIIGKNVNLASRIESYTVGGQILISAVTKNAVGDALRTRGEQAIVPKGVKSPIMIYDVEALGRYSMPDETQHFKELTVPIKLEVLPLEGKFSRGDSVCAVVTALSEKEARVVLDPPIDVNTNVRFIYNGSEVYAKITRPDIMHFTMGTMTCAE